MKSWTCRGRRFRAFRKLAKSTAFLVSQPGWEDTKYGTRYCSLFAFREACWNFFSNSRYTSTPGFFIRRKVSESTCSGATFKCPPRGMRRAHWMYSWSRLARSIHRTPDATITFLTPGDFPHVPHQFLDGLMVRDQQFANGRVDAGRSAAFFSVSGSEHVILYILAVGPPKSLRMPLYPGTSCRDSTSANTLSRLLD